MRGRTIVRVILFSAFMMLFLVSALYFGKDFFKYYKVKSGYQKIAEENKKGRNIDWDALERINKDIVAWIEIPGTPIDYPVVQAKDNREYLSKDIRKRHSIYGTLFLDERLYGTDLEREPNNIIYGHNMGRWTDVMFTSLRKYLEEGYLKKHDTVILYTRRNSREYKIVSVMHADETSDVYYTGCDFYGISFYDWCIRQKDLSLYQTKEDGCLYENALTLSTCDTTHNTDKKIVLFCLPKK